jgi:hypothetical protein
VVRGEPRLVVSSARLTFTDPGLLSGPLTVESSRLAAAYVATFNRPPGATAPVRRKVRAFRLPAPSSLAIPNLSSEAHDHNVNLLLIFEPPVDIGDLPRPLLFARLLAGWSLPTDVRSGKHVRGFLASVDDEDAARRVLSAVTAVGTTIPEDVARRLSAAAG